MKPMQKNIRSTGMFARLSKDEQFYKVGVGFSDDTASIKKNKVLFSKKYISYDTAKNRYDWLMNKRTFDNWVQDPKK